MTPPARQRELDLGVSGNGEAPPWADSSDDELLALRVCDLKLRIKDSDVEKYVHRLYEELEDKGVSFKPPCYLTTEWLAPDKTPLIGIPFCLAHPRLRQLERTMMLEVEGGTEAEFMKLMRHEAGHAINYAYKLYRRSRWRNLFGPFSAEYNVQDYFVRPYSRQYVVHLQDNYAQSHPDEDFAETFAVWLSPTLDWRAKYKNWGALRKLEYVDHLMNTVGQEPALVTTGNKLWPANRIRSTLATYYKKKRVELAEAYPGYYDPDLLQLFSRGEPGGRLPASTFLSQNRRALTHTIARWSRVPKYMINQLIKRLTRRSRELSLYVDGPEEDAILQISAYLCAAACGARERQDLARPGREED